MAFAHSILVSDWATDRQPVIYTSKDELFMGHTREEKEYLDMPRKFFCKCGHVSKGEIAQIIRIPKRKYGWGYIDNTIYDGDGKYLSRIEQPELPDDFDPKKDSHLFRANFVCPECKQPPDLVFDWNMSAAHVHYDYVKVFDNRSKEESNHSICLSIGISEYYFNRNVEKIGYKKKVVRLTFNTNTGMTYAIKAYGNRLISNCSYGNYPRWISPYIYNVCIKYEDTVLEFIRLLAECKLQWITFEQIQGLSQRGTCDKLIYTTSLCALPQLQCLPFTRYNFDLIKDKRKIRRAGFNGKALMMLFAGNASKQVRKFITNENRLYSYLNYRRIFKDHNNLMKLLLAQNDTDRQGNNHGVYCLAKDFEEVNGYDETEQRRKRQTYQFMINLHRDEAHFTQALLKVHQRIFMGYRQPAQLAPPQPVDYGAFAVAPSAEPYHQNCFVLNHAWYQCKDIVRMLEDILVRDLTYRWEYNGDIQELHDRLSRDLERYRNPYQAIPYSDEEKEIYNRTIKGYTFRLAESNHELTRIGSEQNICVGGYGNRAIEKQCVIVLVENSKGEHRITIELNRGRYYMSESDNIVFINQAKLKRNDRPADEEAKIVAEYCYETNTRWENCYDLQAAKGCEWPEIPTGQSPVWIKASQINNPQKHFALRQEAQRIMGIEQDPVPEVVYTLEAAFPPLVNGVAHQAQQLPQPVFVEDFQF